MKNANVTMTFAGNETFTVPFRVFETGISIELEEAVSVAIFLPHRSVLRVRFRSEVVVVEVNSFIIVNLPRYADHVSISVSKYITKLGIFGENVVDNSLLKSLAVFKLLMSIVQYNGLGPLPSNVVSDRFYDVSKKTTHSVADGNIQVLSGRWESLFELLDSLFAQQRSLCSTFSALKKVLREATSKFVWKKSRTVAAHDE